MPAFKNPLFRTLVLLIIVLIVGIVGYKKLTETKQNSFYAPMSANNPTPTPALLENDVHSVDGTLKLILRTEPLQDGTKKYSFFIADIHGNNERLLFTKILDKNITMIIPSNTWSPDNKYVFIRQNNVGSFETFVLKANGDAFVNGKQYLDVVSLSIERKLKYAITDVTGWDSPTLLHVKTSGPNFWFEVTSSAFIQLAS